MGPHGRWREIIFKYFFLESQLWRGCWKSTETSRKFFNNFLFLCTWWWEIKTKEDEKKKKKEGVLEGCLLFSFLLFWWFFSWLFDLDNVFGPNLVVFFEDSNGVEFLEFWIKNSKNTLVSLAINNAAIK